MIALGALLILAAVLAWREWIGRQDRVQMAQERAEWVSERRELLNRVKPETAQYVQPDFPEAQEPESEDEWLDEAGEAVSVNGGS